MHPFSATRAASARSHRCARQRGAIRHDGCVTHYDLAVIGTGSGNTIVTKKFKDWRVAIIEEGVFGGTCLNVGCIPTKMFVYPADLARLAEQRARPSGWTPAFDGARWPEIRDRIFGRIDPIVAERRGLPATAAQHRPLRGPLHLRRRPHPRHRDDGVADHRRPDRDRRRRPGQRRPTSPASTRSTFHTSDTVMRLHGPASPDDHRRRRLRRRRVRAHLLRARHRGHPGRARPAPAAARTTRTSRARFTELAGRQWEVRLDTAATKVQQRDGGRPCSPSPTAPSSRPTYC